MLLVLQVVLLASVAQTLKSVRCRLLRPSVAQTPKSVPSVELSVVPSVELSGWWCCHCCKCKPTSNITNTNKSTTCSTSTRVCPRG